MQSVEFLLTAAVSALGVMFLIHRVINWKSGLILLVLFIAHLPFTDSAERLYFTYIYLAIGAVYGIFFLYQWKSGKLSAENDPD